MPGFYSKISSFLSLRIHNLMWIMGAEAAVFCGCGSTTIRKEREMGLHTTTPRRISLRGQNQHIHPRTICSIPFSRALCCSSTARRAKLVVHEICCSITCFNNFQHCETKEIKLAKNQPRKLTSILHIKMYWVFDRKIVKKSAIFYQR